jgi:hypothetical protein
LNFLDTFKKKPKYEVLSKRAQISSLIKILPVGEELFHAKRRTDMTKLTVAFRNSANAPKTQQQKNISYHLKKRAQNNHSTEEAVFIIIKSTQNDFAHT